MNYLLLIRKLVEVSTNLLPSFRLCLAVIPAPPDIRGDKPLFWLVLVSVWDDREDICSTFHNWV